MSPKRPKATCSAAAAAAVNSETKGRRGRPPTYTKDDAGVADGAADTTLLSRRRDENTIEPRERNMENATREQRGRARTMPGNKTVAATTSGPETSLVVDNNDNHDVMVIVTPKKRGREAVQKAYGEDGQGNSAPIRSGGRVTHSTEASVRNGQSKAAAADNFAAVESAEDDAPDLPNNHGRAATQVVDEGQAPNKSIKEYKLQRKGNQQAVEKKVSAAPMRRGRSATKASKERHVDTLNWPKTRSRLAARAGTDNDVAMEDGPGGARKGEADAKSRHLTEPVAEPSEKRSSTAANDDIAPRPSKKRGRHFKDGDEVTENLVASSTGRRQTFQSISEVTVKGTRELPKRRGRPAKQRRDDETIHQPEQGRRRSERTKGIRQPDHDSGLRKGRRKASKEKATQGAMASEAGEARKAHNYVSERRGRPPNGASSANANVVQSTASLKRGSPVKDVIEPTAKRRRGRPRKVHQSQTEMEVEKLGATIGTYDISKTKGKEAAKSPRLEEEAIVHVRVGSIRTKRGPVNDPAYWLMKAEPESRIQNGKDVKFSIDDLALSGGPQSWDGVRNHVAKKHMLAMKKGDLAFFYHSSCSHPGIVGIMEISKEATPDESAFDPTSPYYDSKSRKNKPTWFSVHVALCRKFGHPDAVTLDKLRDYAKAGQPLENMQLFRQSRLSVTSVRPAEWNHILGFAAEDIHVHQADSQRAPGSAGAASTIAREPTGPTSSTHPHVADIADDATDSTSSINSDDKTVRKCHDAQILATADIETTASLPLTSSAGINGDVDRQTFGPTDRHAITTSNPPCPFPHLAPGDASARSSVEPILPSVAQDSSDNADVGVVDKGNEAGNNNTFGNESDADTKSSAATAAAIVDANPASTRGTTTPSLTRPQRFPSADADPALMDMTAMTAEDPLIFAPRSTSVPVMTIDNRMHG